MHFIFDMDGVIVNTHTPWLEEYNREYNDTLQYSDITSWGMHEFVKPECGTKIYDYLKQPGFFYYMDPLPGAVEILQKIKADTRHQITLGTAPPWDAPTAVFDKIQWIKKYLPFIEIDKEVVLLNAKYKLHADLIFDDKPATLDDFPGISVAMSYKYNRGHGDFRTPGTDPAQAWQWFYESIPLFEELILLQREAA